MSFENAVRQIYEIISASANKKRVFSEADALALANHLKDNPRAKIQPLVARYKLPPALILQSKILVRVAQGN